MPCSGWRTSFYNLSNKNIQPETFSNFDANFIVFINEDGLIFNKFYYNFDRKEFTLFPVELTHDLGKIIKISRLNEDVTGVFQVGYDNYFIAATDITDSNFTNCTNGKVMLGRIIDDDITEKMGRISGASVVSMDRIDDIDQELVKQNSKASVIKDITLSEKKDKSTVKFLIPNVYSASESVMVTMTKQRDLYISAMKQIWNFTLVNVIVTGIVFVVVFILIGIYMSKPLMLLIKEVKSIDLKEREFIKLKEYGSLEFSFLRRTINNLLREIEVEQMKVRDNEEKLYATLISVGDGVIAVDEDSRIQFMNPIAQQLTGWKQEDALGQHIETVFRIINEYTREPVENPVKLVFETEKIIELTNHTLLISKDGEEKPIEDTAAPIKNKSGRVAGCVLVFKDFSERKEKQRRIEYLSYHDPLTGLYNRRYFEEELMRMDSTKNLPISFVYADVNGLKTINDAFGHQCGDELITHVSDVFTAECRSDDIIARTGGDEFIILLPRTNFVCAEKLVKRIKWKIEQKKIMDINISISLGWDTKNTEDQSAWDVLKNAENFMYHKKICNSSCNRSAVIRSSSAHCISNFPWSRSIQNRWAYYANRLAEPIIWILMIGQNLE